MTSSGRTSGVWRSFLEVSTAVTVALSPSCVSFASELDTTEGNAAAELQVGQGGDTPDWSCLERTGSAGAPRTARNLTYSFSMQNFVTGAPVRNVDVRACFSTDLACVSPLVGPLSSGADSRLDVTVPEGFDGYLEITGEGMIATLMFFVAPWSELFLDALDANPVLLFPAPILEANGSLSPPVVTPSTGGIGVLTVDCAGAPTAGVGIDINTDGVPIALVDGLFVQQDLTGSSGLTGFAQVPPGVVVLKEFVAGQPDPIAVESLLVRPGWFTIISLIPGPIR